MAWCLLLSRLRLLSGKLHNGILGNETIILEDIIPFNLDQLSRTAPIAFRILDEDIWRAATKLSHGSGGMCIKSFEKLHLGTILQIRLFSNAVPNLVSTEWVGFRMVSLTAV